MSSFSSLGFTCWLTGLSGAGKSTVAVEIARALDKLSIPCEHLDGDIIRTNLSKGLGFSREDRNTNVSRVGFVCGLLNKHGVSAVVSLISPYKDGREKLRLYLPNFIEVYLDTPLARLYPLAAIGHEAQKLTVRTVRVKLAINPDSIYQL